MSTTRLRPRSALSFRMAGTLMTPEEFDAVTRYDDRFRYELIRRVLIVAPVPLAQETGPNEQLGYLLLSYRNQHPNGSHLDYTLPEQYIYTLDSRRRADRLIWVGLGRMPKVNEDLPAIVVEFVSKAKRDRHRDHVEKRAEYLALGIREYWLFDRFQRVLTVFQPGVPDRIVKENEGYATLLLPGFEIVPAGLFTLADLFDSA